MAGTLKFSVKFSRKILRILFFFVYLCGSY